MGAALGPRQSGIAPTLVGHVAAHPARAAPGSVLVEQRRRRRDYAGGIAVRTAQPQFRTLNRFVRLKGESHAIVSAAIVGEQFARVVADQLIRAPTESALRRDENESAAAAGLPCEVAGYLHQILIALARIDQRAAQIMVERGVAAKQQYRAIGQGQGGHLQGERIAVDASPGPQCFFARHICCGRCLDQPGKRRCATGGQSLAQACARRIGGKNRTRGHDQGRRSLGAERSIRGEQCQRRRACARLPRRTARCGTLARCRDLACGRLALWAFRFLDFSGHVLIPSSHRTKADCSPGGNSYR